MTENEARRVGRPKEGWHRAQGSMVSFFFSMALMLSLKFSAGTVFRTGGLKIEPQFIYFLR